MGASCRLKMFEVNTLENRLLSYKFLNNEGKLLSYEKVVLDLNKHLLEIYNECNQDIRETYIRYAGYLCEAITEITNSLEKEPENESIRI